MQQASHGACEIGDWVLAPASSFPPSVIVVSDLWFHVRLEGGLEFHTRIDPDLPVTDVLRLGQQRP
jgi:hypothetical protein